MILTQTPPMKIGRRVTAAFAASWMAAVVGCGSGGNPDLNHQVIYSASAAGDVSFRLGEISSGASRHDVPDTVFHVADGERVQIVLINMPPPYRALFEWISGGTVRIDVEEIQGVTITDAGRISSDEPTAEVVLRRNEGEFATEQAGREAWFEVCAPDSDDVLCQVGAEGVDGGITGRKLTRSTAGDSRLSHILDGKLETPALIFLERPQDNVSGIFRGEGNERLHAELHLDGELIQQETGASDLVLSEDL